MVTKVKATVKPLFDLVELFNGDDTGSRNRSVLDGDVVTVHATWTIDEVLTTPSTFMALQLYPPSGSAPTVTNTDPSTGVTVGVFTPAVVGLWGYQWEGQHGGGITVNKRGHFYVVRSNLDVIVPEDYS